MKYLFLFLKERKYFSTGKKYFVKGKRIFSIIEKKIYHKIRKIRRKFPFGRSTPIETVSTVLINFGSGFRKR